MYHLIALTVSQLFHNAGNPHLKHWGRCENGWGNFPSKMVWNPSLLGALLLDLIWRGHPPCSYIMQWWLSLISRILPGSSSWMLMVQCRANGHSQLDAVWDLFGVVCGQCYYQSLKTTSNVENCRKQAAEKKSHCINAFWFWLPSKCG